LSSPVGSVELVEPTFSMRRGLFLFTSPIHLSLNLLLINTASRFRKLHRPYKDDGLIFIGGSAKQGSLC
jgi:hypothetical protein